jgi:molybdopterin/thiamine biosynthesis adenylyltransferase
VTNRYHRQSLLPFFGPTGQARLNASQVLLVGCGALGSVIADQLVRAGVGHLTLVDRDVVEWTNLQRQVLFDESDAREGVPKAIAAARRLEAINSDAKVTPQATDVHAGNVESFVLQDPHRDTDLRSLRSSGERSTTDANSTGRMPTRLNLIIDGTDNVETRYLLNDVAVKHGIPWIYGACVGTEGRMMTIRPGTGPCLQCVFPEPAGVGELQTCDTAGVLGPAIAVVAGYQSAAALKILSGNIDAVDRGLSTIDFWKNRHRTIDTGERRTGCPCCDRREFRFLDRPAEASTATLCGRNSVQVRPATPGKLDLQMLAGRLRNAGKVESSPFLLRLKLPGEIVLTMFTDGRCIVQGTSDPARARSLVSQYVGT